MQELASKYSRDAVYFNDFSAKLLAAKPVFEEIYRECGNEFLHGCGSYLFEGVTYRYSLDMYPKQRLLFEVARNQESVLEIGTYMGHSLLIMLLANPDLEITCIDIDDRYTRPAVRVLNAHFSNRVNFIHADSLAALANFDRHFDLFHIDGRHNAGYIAREFALCEKLSRGERMRVVFDDVKCCKAVVEDILKTREVRKYMIPGGGWANCYLEIKNDRNRLTAQKSVSLQ